MHNRVAIAPRQVHDEPFTCRPRRLDCSGIPTLRGRCVGVVRLWQRRTRVHETRSPWSSVCRLLWRLARRIRMGFLMSAFSNYYPAQDVRVGDVMIRTNGAARVADIATSRASGRITLYFDDYGTPYTVDPFTPVLVLGR